METVDVFKADRRTIDTQKVCFAIWKNKGNATFIRDFTRTLCKFVEEKRVFNEIEFYLPQLAHLIVHLDEDWTFRSLERFALILSQTSMHTALQLCFILTAAMEDYQPENAKCEKNPDANPQYFFRCSSLLRNIERVVVFGTVCMTEVRACMHRTKQASAPHPTCAHPSAHSPTSLNLSLSLLCPPCVRK